MKKSFATSITLASIALAALTSAPLSYAGFFSEAQRYHFHGFNNATRTNVDLVFHVGKNITPFAMKMIIDRFSVNRGTFGCTVSDANNATGTLSTFSVNVMPFNWSGEYGKVSGRFTLPSTPYGPSTIEWKVLYVNNCVFPEDSVTLIRQP